MSAGATLPTASECSKEWVHVEHSKHMTVMGKSFGVWPTRSSFTGDQHAFVTSAPGSHYVFNPINVYRGMYLISASLSPEATI